MKGACPLPEAKLSICGRCDAEEDYDRGTIKFQAIKDPANSYDFLYRSTILDLVRKDWTNESTR